MAQKLNAIDVLNWEYLCRVADAHSELAYTTDIQRAIEKFAFAFTQATDVDDQNEVLTQLLEDATFGNSAAANDEVLDWFAEFLCTDRRLLREFARQQGIRISKRN